MELFFRSILESDMPILFQIYASTRRHEMDMVVDWSHDQKTKFLQQQFLAQHQYYQQQFADANFDLICVGEKGIGRLYIDRREKEIRIIDIALLPEYRNHGIGTRILKNLLTEAIELNKLVRIHVEKMNPALKLYKRLGFKIIEDKGVYLLMEFKSGRNQI